MFSVSPGFGPTCVCTRRCWLQVGAHEMPGKFADNCFDCLPVARHRRFAGIPQETRGVPEYQRSSQCQSGQILQNYLPGRVNRPLEQSNARVHKPRRGVPPFGFGKKLRIFIDPDLLQYDEVWAAAGTWNDVFPITPNDLVRASGGVVTDLKRT